VTALFFAVDVLIVVGIHVYLWKRLVRDTTARRGAVRRLGAVAIALAFASVIAALLGMRVLSLSGERWIAWPAYVWLAVMFYLFIWLVLLEVPRLLLRRWARRTAATPARPAPPASALVVAGAPDSRPSTMEMVRATPAPVRGTSRRLVLARTLAVTAGLATAGTVGYGMTQALGSPRLARIRVPIAKLPPRMDGLRIAVVSDLHLGVFLGRADTQRVVDIINSTSPDLVAVVGDVVDGTVAELGAAVSPLGNLRARYGSFFVTGNHEYYAGYAPWVAEVQAQGLRVLRNERVQIDGLDLAGVNDATGVSYDDPPDYERALGGRDPARPAVLLAHQPAQAHEAARLGADLQLSGHTHGGQFYPFDYIVRWQQPIVSGLGRVDGMPVYVTNGTGFWGPPVRVGAPPQVSVVELRAP
jgi:uncharacterized protein